MRTVTIEGQRYELDRERVEAAVAGVLPDPVREHYVVISGRRYPPKQVIALLTGLDRADFTTHQARRILMRLGFPAARRTPRAPHVVPEPERRSTPSTDTLRPYIGQWVAVRGDEVLVAADGPEDVIAWLTEHGLTADSLFGVPVSEDEVHGMAPL